MARALTGALEGHWRVGRQRWQRTCSVNNEIVKARRAWIWRREGARAPRRPPRISQGIVNERLLHPYVHSCRGHHAAAHKDRTEAAPIIEGGVDLVHKDTQEGAVPHRDRPARIP
eukprot:5136462-Prymnesium_polylepis.1